MTHSRTLIVAALTIVGAVLVGVLTWQWLQSGEPDAAPTPTPARTAEVTDPTEETPVVTPVDPTGQAAGDFEPLTLPAGVTGGIGGYIPESQLTEADRTLAPGEVGLLYMNQSDIGANPYVLFTVDEITAPLTGTERARAYQAAGTPDDEGQVVQKVTARLRQVAGGGATDQWKVAASLRPVNMKSETMNVIDAGDPACQDVRAPFAGHAPATTVQTCFYVFGAVNTPGSMISSILATGVTTDTTVTVYIQSDKHPDLGLLEASHGEHDWQIDPETGLPLIDPDTGEPIPADPDGEGD